MSSFFVEKYGRGVGGVLDNWGRNPLNREIGDIYEKNVFGQESINVEEILNEYVGSTTGGRVSYSSERIECVKSNKIIQG